MIKQKAVITCGVELINKEYHLIQQLKEEVNSVEEYEYLLEREKELLEGDLRKWV